MLTIERRPIFEWTIRVPAVRETLAELHESIDRFWRDVDRVHPQAPDSTWRLQFTTALLETATNIVRYAYPAGQPGDLTMRLVACSDAIEASFTDAGIPYEAALPGDLPMMPDPDDLLECGYGLALVRTAVDQFDYTRAGTGTNRWHLVKFLGPTSQ